MTGIFSQKFEVFETAFGDSIKANTITRSENLQQCFRGVLDLRSFRFQMRIATGRRDPLSPQAASSSTVGAKYIERCSETTRTFGLIIGAREPKVYWSIYMYLYNILYSVYNTAGAMCIKIISRKCQNRIDSMIIPLSVSCRRRAPSVDLGTKRYLLSFPQLEKILTSYSQYVCSRKF